MPNFMTFFIKILQYFLSFVTLTLAQYGLERGQSNMDMGGGRALLPTCPGMWQWACQNGQCIAKYDVCDGTLQCTDGSDEWNCNDISRLKLNPGKAAEIAANGGMVATTTTTTTTVSSMSNLNLTKNQFFVMLGVTAVLCVAIILFVRRRARMRAVSRNRRIGMGLIRDDSDEDDILISSMYS